MNIWEQNTLNSKYLNFILGLLLTLTSSLYILNHLFTVSADSEITLALFLLLAGAISLFASFSNRYRTAEVLNVALGSYFLVSSLICLLLIVNKVEWLLSAFFANTLDEVFLQIFISIIFFLSSYLGRKEHLKDFDTNHLPP